MQDENEVSGIFDVIDNDGAAHEPVTEPVNTEPVAEGGEFAESTPNTQEAATPSEGGESTPSPTEVQPGTESNPTEATEQPNQPVEIDWRATLPPAPLPYSGPTPEVNEEGQITNMTPEQYQTYLKGDMMASIHAEQYQHQVESAALDAAEQILPEIKTNPGIRQMVESLRLSSILSGGDPIDSYEAAKQVRDALGIAPQKLAEAKAEGAQNAKVSIETQRNAGVESGASQAPNADADKMDHIHKRIRMGDDEAFVDLLNIWEESGKL